MQLIENQEKIVWKEGCKRQENKPWMRNSMLSKQWMFKGLIHLNNSTLLIALLNSQVHTFQVISQDGHIAPLLMHTQAIRMHQSTLRSEMRAPEPTISPCPTRVLQPKPSRCAMLVVVTTRTLIPTNTSSTCKDSTSKMLALLLEVVPLIIIHRLRNKQMRIIAGWWETELRAKMRTRTMITWIPVTVW